MGGKKKVGILGSTGSIGTQTLDVLSAFSDDYEVRFLSCGSRIDLMLEQIQIFQPKYAYVSRSEGYEKASSLSFDHPIEWFSGSTGLCEMVEASDIDILIVAIVGSASLLPTMQAIQKRVPVIGLACKEVLVAGGDIVMKAARDHGVSILPIDSEHAALKQCLAGIDEDKAQFNKLILTASGGPFWQRTIADLQTITPAQALKHPNWEMGAKITIDSATMMNKGLEVIEAHHLFDTPYEKIDVVIHPQSIIHALVEFSDGNIISHMGLPDMRFPIQYVLTYPEKLKNQWPKTNLTELKPLTFHQPNLELFPLLELAYEAGKAGGIMPTVLNAANEAAVSLFLQEKIRFLDIAKCVKKQLKKAVQETTPSLESIVQIDQEIKEAVSCEYTH